MAVHPEMGDGQFGDLIRSIESTERAEAWCLACKKFVAINAAYAKYIQGEIENCSDCRKPN